MRLRLLCVALMTQSMGESVLNVMKIISNLYNLKNMVIYLMQSVTYRFFIFLFCFHITVMRLTWLCIVVMTNCVREMC